MAARRCDRARRLGRGLRRRDDVDLGDAEEFELVDVEGEVDFKIATAEESGAHQKGNGLPGPNQFGVTAPGRHKLVVSGHEGTPGKYSFRMVTLKKRAFRSKPGEVKGTLDVPGRVDVHTFDTASVEIDLLVTKATVFSLWLGGHAAPPIVGRACLSR